MHRPHRFVLGSLLLLTVGGTGGRDAWAALVAPCARQGEPNERAGLIEPRGARIGKQVANIELGYLDGTRGLLSERIGPKGLVIFVRSAECPVSKLYGNETGRIEKEYAARGLGFLLVDMEDPCSRDAAREEIGLFGFQGRYALDPEQRLGAELGATRTTEAFLLDSARTLVYRGAIDDQYGRGFAQEAPRQHYLREALEALLCGEEIQIKATSAPGCVLAPPASADVGEASAPTYHREISRILQQNCVECHRAGGAAPFALDSYDSARRKGATILDVLAQGIMPPWFAAPGTGPWINDRRLSEEERLVIQRWFAAGAPEGDPADAPVPRRWKEGWLIGEPDYVASMPKAFQVPAEGVVPLQDFFVDEPIPRDMWVERMQILPTAGKVVHHVVVHIKKPGKDLGYLFGYLPGSGPAVYSEGVACFVPKGSILKFVVHYTPNGVATVDRTSIGFVLAKHPPEYAAKMKTLRNEDIFIPAGASNVSFTDSYVIPTKVALRSLTPHMHLRGKDFLFEAFLPDGTKQVLLDLTGWDVDWQFSYLFREWPVLPKGTLLKATAWYDNSAANVDNPDPTKDVHNGPQTTDEMMIFEVEWVVPNRIQR